MPKTVEEVPYNGAVQRAERLGIGPLLEELREILTGFQLLVKEAVDSNGGAAVRRLLDERFAAATGWTRKQTGDVDWTKCHTVNGTQVCLGVEIQVSARSDLPVMDIVHLRRAIEGGLTDVGVLVVPSDKLSLFLTDRAPCMSDAKRHVGHAKAEDLPLILIAMEHDGPGPALAKQKKR
ncbi:MAG: hypothetical protein ABSG86_01410 [Thermoguttaceae bacterium]|jgi:hypothetical protein